MPTPTGVVEFTPTTFEQITVTTSATLLSGLLSGGIPAGAKHVIFYPEGDIRWRADGTSPTSSVGIVMKSSQLEVFENQFTLLTAMEMIAGANTLVNVQICL